MPLLMEVALCNQHREVCGDSHTAEQRVAQTPREALDLTEMYQGFRRARELPGRLPSTSSNNAVRLVDERFSARIGSNG
jgi:hypothetical protein